MSGSLASTQASTQSRTQASTQARYKQEREEREKILRFPDSGFQGRGIAARSPWGYPGRIRPWDPLTGSHVRESDPDHGSRQQADPLVNRQITTQGSTTLCAVVRGQIRIPPHESPPGSRAATGCPT